MPFNPSQFVFQPRPLQQFDFGAGFRDLADTRLRKQTIENQNRQANATRQDTNSLAAANFAKDRETTEYDAAVKKYQERLKIADAMRKAQQAMDLGTVEALAPSFQELGGTYRREETDNPDLPNYVIEAGNQPGHSPLDIQGMRSEIYGPGVPKMGKPFEMPSRFAAGGALFAEKNPFDAPALPGVSAEAAGAAAAPQPAPVDPGPPPGPAVDGVTPELPPDAVQPPVEAAPPTPAAASSLPPGTQNPLNPPTFSPYRSSTADIFARNQRQTAPMRQAFEESAPVNFQGRAQAFNRNVAKLGMPPERYQALTDPLIKEATGMYRTELGADIAGQRMANTRDRQAELQAQRDSDTFFKRKNTAYNGAFKALAQAGIKDLNSRQIASHQIADLLKTAGTNGQSAYQLIGRMHDLADRGIMTKEDYIQAAHGNVNLITKIERAFSKELSTPAGLDWDSLDDIVEVANIAAQRLRADLYDASQKVYSLYQHTNDEAERAGYAQALRASFDAEYIPEELTDENQTPEQPDVYTPPPVPTSSGSRDVGVTGVPSTLDGRPKVSPNGVPLTRGSRVPQKPPRKKPISQEVDDLLK